MGQVIRLSLHTRHESAVGLGTLRQLTGMSPAEFAAAVANEAGEPVPMSVYMAYETDEPPPGAILSAARRVAARACPPDLARVGETAADAVSQQARPPQLDALTSPTLSEPAELFMGAAAESTADALLRAGHIGADVMPGLVQHVMQVARSYNSESRLTAFQHARATRDLAVKLTGRTSRPGELADLYVAIGEANALMASLAFDLGKWDACEPIARAATTYAELGGHASLHAWTFGLEATLAFWRGEGDRALHRIEAGLAIAPAGAPRVRLLCIAARAHAVRGDSDGAARVLNAAVTEREIAEGRRDELHDEVAGEFRFDDARAAACAGTAWLKLGNGDEAVRYTRRTLELHDQGRRPVSAGILNGARIDTAAALLLQSNLDEAAIYLEPVFTLAQDAGNVSLGGRLAYVRKLLKAERWASNPAANRLVEQVDGWLRNSRAIASGCQ